MGTLKIGFKTAQFRVDWPTLLATWQLADEMPIFDSGWLLDHLVDLGSDDGSCHEAWTLAAALAASTRRLQLGHLVVSNTFRHPAIVARMAVTMDHVSNGRFVLGLGAGWHEAEHAMHGMRLPPPGERITMLDSAVRVVRALWSADERVTLHAPPYELANATTKPAPLTPGGPPLWLGTQGTRGLRICAELADGWNHHGSPEEFAGKHATLLRHCEALARDPAEIEISAQMFLRGEDYRTLLETATRYARSGVQHVVLILPASQGPDGLRRLATEVAQPLRERFD